MAQGLSWLLALPGVAFGSLRTRRSVMGKVSLLARMRGWRNVKISSLCEVDRRALLAGKISWGRFYQVNENAVLGATSKSEMPRGYFTEKI
jgi:hypothetical protein